MALRQIRKNGGGSCGKINRSQLTRRGAIRLYPAGETLAVAEGIETTLAMRLATQASRLPGRSAVKTGGIFP